MQLYERLYAYIHEYQDLIYRFYSKHAIAFLVNYYNIDPDNSIWDDTKLYGGFYERTGELTGLKFIKYKMLPVYFIEPVSTQFDGSEIGLTKMNETSCVIPSSYGITPNHGSYIKFEQSYLMRKFDDHPIFEVGGIEQSVNTEITFWKMNIKISQSKTVQDIEDQLTNTFAFLDYDKKIHSINDASFLTKMMYKNSKLKDKLESKYFDDNSGFYLA